MSLPLGISKVIGYSCERNSAVTCSCAFTADALIYLQRLSRER
jgi:hypothetical protein